MSQEHLSRQGSDAGSHNFQPQADGAAADGDGVRGAANQAPPPNQNQSPPGPNGPPPANNLNVDGGGFVPAPGGGFVPAGGGGFVPANGGGAVPAGGVMDDGGAQARAAALVDGGIDVPGGVVAGVPAVRQNPGLDGGGPVATPPGPNQALHLPDGRPLHHLPNTQPFRVPQNPFHPGLAQYRPLDLNPFLPLHGRPIPASAPMMDRPAPHLNASIDFQRPAPLPRADELQRRLPPNYQEQQAQIDECQRLLNAHREQYLLLEDQNRQRAALEREQQQLLAQIEALPGDHPLTSLRNRLPQIGRPPGHVPPPVARRLDFLAAADTPLHSPPSHAQSDHFPPYRLPAGADRYQRPAATNPFQLQAEVHYPASEVAAGGQHRQPPLFPQHYLSQAEVDANTRATHPYLNRQWNEGERIAAPPNDTVNQLRRQITALTEQLQQRDNFYRSEVPTVRQSPAASIPPPSLVASSRAHRPAPQPTHAATVAPQQLSPLPRPFIQRRQIQMPPLRCFSGRDATNPTDETPFTDWERKLHAELLATGTHPDDWLATMRMFLDGAAAKLYDLRLSTIPVAFQSYTDMVTALSTTYDIGATQPDAKSQLASLSWDSRTETIPEFYGRIERLTQLANPTFDHYFTRGTARNYFMDALPTSIKRTLDIKLDLLSPAVPELYQLIDWATKIAQSERRLKDSDTARRAQNTADKAKLSSSVADAGPVEKAPDQSHHDTRRRTDDHHRGGPSTNPAASSDARNAGYSQSADPSRNRDADGRSRGGGARRDLSNVSCFHCQQLGHTRPHCPLLNPPPPPPQAGQQQVVSMAMAPTADARQSWGQHGSFPTLNPTNQPPMGYVPPPPFVPTDHRQPTVNLVLPTTDLMKFSEFPSTSKVAENVSHVVQSSSARDTAAIAASAPAPPPSVALAVIPSASTGVSADVATTKSTKDKPTSPQCYTEPRVLTLPVDIAGRTISAQVDTGSPITIMGIEPFQRLLERDGLSAIFAKFRPSNCQFADYSGNAISLHSLIAVDLGIQGGTLRSDVYFDPQSQRDLIIGMDVLSQIGCSLAFTFPQKVNCIVPAANSDVLSSVDDDKSMILPILSISCTAQSVSSVASERTLSGPCTLSEPTTGAARRRDRRRRAKRRATPAAQKPLFVVSTADLKGEVKPAIPALLPLVVDRPHTENQLLDVPTTLPSFRSPNDPVMKYRRRPSRPPSMPLPLHSQVMKCRRQPSRPPPTMLPPHWRPLQQPPTPCFPAPVPLSGNRPQTMMVRSTAPQESPMDTQELPPPQAMSSAASAQPTLQPPPPPTSIRSPNRLSYSGDSLPPPGATVPAQQLTCKYSTWVTMHPLPLEPYTETGDFPYISSARPTDEPYFPGGVDRLLPSVGAVQLPFDNDPQTPEDRAIYYDLQYDYFTSPVQAFLQLNAIRFYQLLELKNALKRMPGYEGTSAGSLRLQKYHQNLNKRLRFNQKIGAHVVTEARSAQARDPSGLAFRRYAKFIRKGFHQTDYGHCDAVHLGRIQLQHELITRMLQVERRNQFVIMIVNGTEVQVEDFVPDAHML